MNDTRRKKIEFGDFQTPDDLASSICKRLVRMGVSPKCVIEPTCGVGAFVIAALREFDAVDSIFGVEVNQEYLSCLDNRLAKVGGAEKVKLIHSDFFQHDWRSFISKCNGDLLILGNFPWVTNSTQGSIGGENLPEKTNFQKRAGFDAISGKANFDISEWMLLEVLRWFKDRAGSVAMLVKNSVARKVLAQAEGMGITVTDAMMIGIDAKKEFGAMVDACLLVIRIGVALQKSEHDYTVYESLMSERGRRVGHRDGLIVGDIDSFNKWKHFVGVAPQKWRSGIKHDASSVMEFTRKSPGLYENGIGEIVELEQRFIYPLLKGSDIGSNKEWRGKFVLVTQQSVGEPTDAIAHLAPKTWKYLQDHCEQLDKRGSVIYKKNPRFSIFGIGDYAFRPWRIAICGLYKKLNFRLIPPIEGKPVMVDDTACYVSFETEAEAQEVLRKLNSDGAVELLSSLIFWDEKRPIKTSILNSFNWSLVD